MDYLYTFLLTIFLVAISLLLHLFFYKSKTTNLPPGTTGWPVVGETYEFLAAGWKGHPEKFVFDRMAEFSPHVFRTSLLTENFAVFCGPTGNKFLFSNEKKLVRAWWPPSFAKLLPSSNEFAADVTRTRKMLPNFLNPEALHRHIPVMDAVAQTHFAEEWAGKENVVTYELAKDFTFRIACKIFLSIDDPERVKYLSGPFERIARGILSIPVDLPGTPLRRGLNAADFIRKEIVTMVKQRKMDLAEGKASGTQDLLSSMLLYKDEDGECMSEFDIASRILGLLIGGHDTTSSLCTCVVKYLAELPQVYRSVYEEQMEIIKSKTPGELLNWKDVSMMKYSWNVACEVLRLAPPAHGNFREAITDFEYKDYHIPKGWKLYWSAYATHKNPEFFPNPDKFEPSRFDENGPAPYTFVPFGGGPHICPGKEYVRLEVLVFMHHLVRNFKWEKIISDEGIVLNPLSCPSKGLPIRLFSHKA